MRPVPDKPIRLGGGSETVPDGWHVVYQCPLRGDRMDEFDRWMRGQTAALCEGRRYNHDTSEYTIANRFMGAGSVMTEIDDHLGTENPGPELFVDVADLIRAGDLDALKLVYGEMAG